MSPVQTVDPIQKSPSAIGGAVTLRRLQTVGLIEIDNPPANALSARVRAGLAQALAEAEADSSIGSVVIACSGRTFITGADIKEFGKSLTAPTAREVFGRIENFAKPVVAAMHGYALGGGLELALCCHYRVAQHGATLGLAEVSLGLIPGCGGTQRLLRLIDPKEAARMVLAGARIDARRAHALGLLDQVVEADLRAMAVEFAMNANRQIDQRRLSKVRFIAPTSPGWSETVHAIAREVRAAKRAPLAAQACIDSLLLAQDHTFESAVDAERSIFMRLLEGRESRAMRSNFFSERACTKVASLDAGVAPLDVTRIAVVGAGTMGRGIAIACADAGYLVDLIDANPPVLEAARGAIEGIYATSISRGRLSLEQTTAAIERIVLSNELSAAGAADLVIEAVFEDMPLKKRIFAELDAIAKPAAVLASNTSTLDIDVIASCTGRASDVVGMHFFSPANVMRLLEVVNGAATSPKSLATAIDVGKRIGKLPVVVGVCDGFVANRMALKRGRQVELLLQEGALPAQIDAVARDFGFAMGPCETSDLAGLDITYRIRQAKGTRAPIADALCERGWFGQKTSRGFYGYAPGSRKPEVDDEVIMVIEAASQAIGRKRRPVSDHEVLERMLLPLINEGARLLEEGIATRPGDIDVIWVNGYGWPVRECGPMFHADEIGLTLCCERLEAYATALADPDLLPCELLRRLAAQGKTIYSLQHAD